MLSEGKLKRRSYYPNIKKKVLRIETEMKLYF